MGITKAFGYQMSDMFRVEPLLRQLDNGTLVSFETRTFDLYIVLLDC